MGRNKRIWREAWTALFSHKLRAFLMMLGIVIGIAALTAVVCVGEGTRTRIMGLVAKSGLDMLMVRPGGTKQVFAPGSDRAISSLNEADATAIESSLRNINLVAIVQNERGWDIKWGDTGIKTRVFGVSDKWEAIRRRGILMGEGISEEDVTHGSKVIVLGYNVWKDLFAEANPVGQTVQLGKDQYRVKGVYVEMGVSADSGDAWDDRVVLPVTTSAKKLFGRDHLEQIVIQVKDVRRIPETKAEIEGLLDERHHILPGGERDYFVREPGDIKDAALETSSTLMTLLTAISGVALVVGGVVIMNIMLLAVAQRVHEIGLRRALGARRADIMVQFLMEAVLVTLVGGLVGTGLGVAFASARAATGHDSQVTWLPFVFAAASCALVAIVFGLYPARKAAGVDPVVALREKQA